MKADRQPKVSIVVPAYNSAKYIGATLNSVLEQSYDDYEVLVVDDGSTDDTRAAVLGLDERIRYIYQRNQGPAAARNTGLNAAAGELICFLDADDLWTPDKLRIQVEFMERHRDVGLVFSDEEEFEGPTVQCASLLATSRFHQELAAGSILNGAFGKLLEENFIPTSTVTVRRTCFARTGLFDTALKGPEDRDMWSRIAVLFQLACIPEVLGRKRIVTSSVSRDVETTLRSRILLWTKARRQFPHLAPARTVNALLASTYLQLGFVVLQKNNTRDARIAALRTFSVSRSPYQCGLAAGLVIFSFTGKGFANLLFRSKRRLSAASR